MEPYSEVEAVERWAERFGEHNPQLAVARAFAAERLGREGPAAREAERRREEARREARLQEQLRSR